MPEKKNPTTGKPSQNTSFPYNFTTPDYIDVPTKSIDIEKPINGFDYLNALVRIPEVKKDLELLNKEPDNKGKRLELCNKYWGIYGFSPELLQNTRAFFKHNKYFHNSEAIHVFSNWEKEPLLGGRWEHDPLSKYRDGRHVLLAVDVTKKKQNIINEFKKLLNRIEKDYDIPKDTSKNKNTVKDIWNIYDQRVKDIKWSVITSQVLGKYSRNNERQVIRYYNKAREIINTVKREVEKAIIENAKRQKTHNELMEMISKAAEEQRKKGRTITIADRLLGRIPKKTKRK